jgi:hypothetical protein
MVPPSTSRNFTMYKTMIALLACCLLATPTRAAGPAAQWAEAAALPDLTQTRPAAPELLGLALAGQWQGRLEYRDYGNDQRVVLPTSASIAGDSAALGVAFVYDDGPGKTVRGNETWSLSADGAGFSMAPSAAPMTVSAYRGGDGRDVTLIALGAGTENQMAVQVRLVLTRRGDQLTISRASQLPGQPWLLRHAYHLALAR